MIVGYYYLSYSHTWINTLSEDETMALAIKRAVGIGGANENMDVKIIQALLNVFDAWDKKVDKLKVNGVIDQSTKNAIKEFQKQIVKLKKIDGRVDPDHKTFRYLTMYLSEAEQNSVLGSLIASKTISKKISVTKEKIKLAKKINPPVVSYKSKLPDKKRIVSEYSKSVIKMALKESGMSHAVISSTIRTPEEQADAMYDNAKLNYKGQYNLYGIAGQSVLKVFKKNQTKNKKEVVKLMVDEINELAKEGIRVSLHCVSESDYAKLNVIDIGVGSTRKISKNFNIKKFTAALEDLKKEGYIKRIFDETKKVNNAWHIEVLVNGKALPAN